MKTYWVQASSVALSTENHDDAAALLQLAHTGDLLTEASEIQILAELLMLRGIPHRAALLLERAIADKRLTGDARSFELLSNCWIVARDYARAIEPLTRASELGATGELYVRLAQLYAQQEDWSGAVGALQRGIEKGNLKQPGLAQLLMGMARFHQKNLPEARVWFQRAAAHREQKTHAEAWLNHTEKTLAAGAS
jgi:tetratricopeptide (TPR) repeat protein